MDVTGASNDSRGNALLKIDTRSAISSGISETRRSAARARPFSPAERIYTCSRKRKRGGTRASLPTSTDFPVCRSYHRVVRAFVEEPAG